MSANRRNVLSVSSYPEDHTSLQRLLIDSSWAVVRARDLPSARAVLRQKDIPVVICASELGRDVWVELLNETAAAPSLPSMIISSRLADDRLWAEALNLGAWDVSAKPFDRTEVLRSFRYAAEHCDQMRMAAKPIKMVRAAS